MGQITFKTGTITFKGATLSFKSNHAWVYVNTFSSFGPSYDYDFEGDAEGDPFTARDMIEDLEPANNVPGAYAQFYDTSAQEYYVFVSTY
jgi:hypothetical protein